MTEPSPDAWERLDVESYREIIEWCDRWLAKLGQPDPEDRGEYVEGGRLLFLGERVPASLRAKIERVRKHAYVEFRDLVAQAELAKGY